MVCINREMDDLDLVADVPGAPIGRGKPTLDVEIEGSKIVIPTDSEDTPIVVVEDDEKTFTKPVYVLVVASIRVLQRVEMLKSVH